MADFFYWSSDDDSTDQPRWMTAALDAGIVRIEKGGTPEVCLVIDGRRFPRNSLIMRSGLDAARRRGPSS